MTLYRPTGEMREEAWLLELYPWMKLLKTDEPPKSNSRTAPKTVTPPPVYREQPPESGAPKADFSPTFPHQDRS